MLKGISVAGVNENQTSCWKDKSYLIFMLHNFYEPPLQLPLQHSHK